MEDVVKILFLVMVFSVPLGILAAVVLAVQARKAATVGDGVRAILLRRRAVERLGYTLASGFLGLVGYWLVSRNLIPQLEPELILGLAVTVLFFLYLFIRLKLRVPKWKDWF